MRKGAETLLKYERQGLYHIYWSLRKRLSRENSLLVICKMLRLVVNTLTPLKRDGLTQLLHMQLSQKQRNFSGILFPFLKFILNLEHLKKKDDPHSWCISQITDFEKLRLRLCFYHIFWSQWRQLRWEKSLIAICKILRLLVNRFTAEEKYSLLNRDNLTQPINMQYT